MTHAPLMSLHVTYVGGPTALLEWSGLRLLTDPTFDPAGTSYETPTYTLRKTRGPAIGVDAIGPLDVVLLSHDHHSDNLDRAGRTVLGRAAHVVTTVDGAARLGGGAIGLAPWATRDLATPDGSALHVTATPARHGPAHADRGPVVGFALTRDAGPETVYVSGDTVWFEGIADVARRFDVRVALLFLGAAQVRAVGEWNLTLTADEAVEVARAMPRATILPLHYEGWEHFSESRDEVDRAFRAAGLTHRLRWLRAGLRIEVGGASDSQR